jgi:hypothetical protein
MLDSAGYNPLNNQRQINMIKNHKQSIYSPHQYNHQCPLKSTFSKEPPIIIIFLAEIQIQNPKYLEAILFSLLNSSTALPPNHKTILN